MTVLGDETNPSSNPLPEAGRRDVPPPRLGEGPGEGSSGCPFCGAGDSEIISLFGSQHLVDQRRCRACRSYFEALRDDR